MNDGSNLYIAIDSQFNDGWDNHASILFDGNTDHDLDGSSTQPHEDVVVVWPGPSGWSGYRQYKLLGSDNKVSAPDAVERASGNHSGTVHYEFQVPLTETLGASSGDTVGVFLRTHTPDHGREERFYWPLTPQDDFRENIDQWAKLILE